MVGIILEAMAAAPRLIIMRWERQWQQAFWELERKMVKRTWQIYWWRWLRVRRDGIFAIVYFVELV
jgi:hypothetical protein